MKNYYIELLLKDKLRLSVYLHDLGVCPHFQNDPLLKKTVILKPKWGTEAVYKVLDNDNVIRKLGRFGKKDLAKIWDEPARINLKSWSYICRCPSHSNRYSDIKCNPRTKNRNHYQNPRSSLRTNKHIQKFKRRNAR